MAELGCLAVQNTPKNSIDEGRVMSEFLYRTEQGLPVPTVTEEQMREVDRIAVEDFNLGILQMMENAGRNLAIHVMEMRQDTDGDITILAGPGGNGGGGLCCARHLHNRGIPVHILLSKDVQLLRGSVKAQLDILLQVGLRPVVSTKVEEAIKRSAVVVDALIGYSLNGPPRNRIAELIDLCNQYASQVISLDLPSGMDATSGKIYGRAIESDRILTLALPKIGLQRSSADLYLADIGIPPEVYTQLGVVFEPFFAENFWVRLLKEEVN
jgi:NAD(P)H-hydrate epimerase